MVIRVTETEARDALSDLLDRVAAGERIVIEVHGEQKVVLINLNELQNLEQAAVREARPAYASEAGTETSRTSGEKDIHPDSIEAHVRRMAETGEIEWEGWLGDDVLDALGITREDVIRALQTPIEEIQERVGRSLKPGETLADEIIRMREE
jgi:prevent-host-death family protein